MDQRANPASIFSQKLDRVAFVAYLLGAVVPLIALAVVVQRFVLPGITDRLAIFGLVGAVVSIAVLSLASFFTLRRTTRTSLSQMDGDNRRLAALLEVSGSLAGASHPEDAGLKTANNAVGLVQARAAFVLMRGEPGAAPSRLAAAGEDADKLEIELVEPMVEMAKLVLSTGRPALGGRTREQPAMCAVPLPGEAVSEGVLLAVGKPQQRGFSAADVDALTSLGRMAAVALRKVELHDSQRNFFTHVTDLLVSALDSSLGYNKGHGTRAAQYANRLGREMGLDDHRLQRLHFAALLHDVGMLKLDRQHQQSAKTAAKHTVLGGRMLARIRLWQDLAPIVQHHHEWWDGSGYPDGLSGPSIPLESRIISVVDVFDTITSEASYRDSMSFERAAHEIEAGAGTQFDPEVVAAFSALVKRDELEIVAAPA